MQVSSSYSQTQISEAKQAIYRLSSFPESRSDLRLTSELHVIRAQGKIQKIISSLTCNCCCSRRLYDAQTNLAHAYSRLREVVRILVHSREIKTNELRDACVGASHVFNSIILHCSQSRKKDLSHLRVDMNELIEEMEKRETNPPSPPPSFPKQGDGSINYQLLFRRSPLVLAQGASSVAAIADTSIQPK